MNTPDHPFGNGFLSEAAREVRNEVHKKYAEYVELLYSTNRHAVTLQHALIINPQQLEQTIGAVLYARTLASTQSSALLLEYGLPSQARTILRAGLESLFPLAAIAKQPNIAASLIASHDADRKTLVDRIQRWKDPALRASIESKISDAELDAISKGTGKATNIYELAKLADMEDWYLTLYTLLSFSAHAKISDLDRHVVVNANGIPTEFKNEPDTADQESIWAWTTEVQQKAMRSVSAIFSLDCAATEGLGQRLRELARKTQ